MSIAPRHKYEFAVDLEAESAPTHVMRLVGASKRVLEIGCGPGSVTKLLAQHERCRVTGLDVDPTALEKAASYCERVMQADLNTAEWPKVLEGAEPFDVVVAADVLEHLYDPWTALRQMGAFIHSTGYLVISLPHVGHAAVAACLINGDFEYREWGLLDRTHIRFFGLKNIEDLFAQAGLKIVDVRYVLKTPEETEFSASWYRLSARMQEALSSVDHADVYQVVLKAVPVAYPGKRVALIPPARRSAQPALTKLWRVRLRNYLSPHTQRRIRQGLSLLRIRL